MNKPSSWNEGCSSVHELLQAASRLLGGAGVDSASWDAELLMRHHLGVDRTGLFMKKNDILSDESIEQYHHFLLRRVAREPLAYIVGSTGFWDLDLAVEPGILVPRPDTETLIDAALAVLPSSDVQPLCMVDLGTGSGAIALSMASALPGHRMIATDRSGTAIRVARANAGRNAMAEAVAFVRGIWFDPFDESVPAFDVVLSNPPYIPSAEIETLEPEVSVFEPRLALDGDADGLRDLRLIVSGCVHHLKPKGWLLLEMGWDQRESVRAILEAVGIFEEITFFDDYGGNNRVVRARRVPLI